MTDMMNEAVAAGSKRDRTILLAGLITYGVGQSLLYIILMPLGLEIGLSGGQLGTIISISNLAILFTAPVWGKTSDSWGRRTVFVIGMVGYGIGYALLAVGIQAGMAGVVLGLPLFLGLLAARLVYGVFAGAAQPAAQAYIADTTDAASRPQGMAMIAAAGGLGTIVGPIFALLLAKVHPLAPMYGAAVIGIVCAVWAHSRLVEPVKHEQKLPSEGTLRVIRIIFPYLLGWCVVFFVFTAIQLIAGLLLGSQIGITDADALTNTMGIAFISMAIMTVIMQVVVMQKIKMQPRLLLRVAFILFGLVLLVLPTATTTMEVYLVFIGMGFTVSLVMPSLTSAASLTLGPQDQGIGAGLLAAAPTFGMVLGPMTMGFMFEKSPVLSIQFCALMVILTGIYFWFVNVPLAPLVQKK
ncbi:MAG: MFS transporter [Gammaproteobacteria bacterium]|nr:MFS transporter [Gammaproteobacteria bacterium]MCP4089445.1 MFS transporter [Gammaproteobacteria bacterium]MCP4277561.1 MFS transporter [Gammaproteobacteria bacterium]MCP4831169.1 MFS transporter [Gammaproteobacteria bacterium]